MSAVVIAAILAAAAAASAGGWIGFRFLRRPKPFAPVRRLPPPSGSQLPHVGDVVVIHRNDFWLTSALQLREGPTTVVQMLFTSDGDQGSVLVVASKRMAWLQPIDVELAEHVPDVVEVEQRLLKRVFRTPVSLVCEGHPIAAMPESAVVHCFDGPDGSMLIVLRSAGATRCWMGSAIRSEELMVLASAGATMRSES